MKTQQALLLTVVLAIILAAAVPLAQGLTPARKATPWPCCDDCGACTRSLPPQCQCRDASPAGCHPACKSCDKFADSAGAALFVCRDRITNFCKNRCTPAA